MIGYTLAIACIVIGWAVGYTAWRDGQPTWIVAVGFFGGPALGVLIKILI